MDRVIYAQWQKRSLFEVFPGINACELWSNDKGEKAMVVKIEPGGKWQGFDIHESGAEEIFVVEGTFNDGERDYPAGTFIHYPQGTSHVPQSATGCLLFVFYPNNVGRSRLNLP